MRIVNNDDCPVCEGTGRYRANELGQRLLPGEPSEVCKCCDGTGKQQWSRLNPKLEAVEAHECRCKMAYCGHVWASAIPGGPDQCPRCRSYNWRTGKRKREFRGRRVVQSQPAAV